MKVIKSENIKFFDVDDTLVLPEALGNIEAVHISVYDPITGKRIKLRKHLPMIRLLEEESHRGAFVVVWSRGGFDWASSVVSALGLEDKVNLVMSKPLAYFDDKDASEWMNNRVYLAPDTSYKKID